MKLRHFLFFLAIVILVVLAYNQIHQVQSVGQLIKSVHWWILLLAIPARFIYYWSNAKYFEHFMAIFKQKAPFAKLFEATVTMNFVNIVFPSGGISGLSYIRKALADDVDSTQVTLAQLCWYVLSFVGYVLFLSLAFALLILSNQVIQISSRIIILVLFIILAVGIATVMFIFNPDFVESATIVAFKPVNKVLQLIRRRVFGKERIKRFLDQLRESVTFLRKNYRVLGKPFLYCCLMILADVLTIYIVFVAFGQIINPGIVVAGYIIALISSLASVITAGVGVYEAGMVATFVGLNVAFDVAFAVTIMYRIIALWLFIPIGLLFYKRTLLDKKKR